MSQQDLINKLVNLPLVTQGWLMQDLDPYNTNFIAVIGDKLVLDDRQDETTEVYTIEELTEHWTNYVDELTAEELSEVNKVVNHRITV